MIIRLVAVISVYCECFFLADPPSGQGGNDDDENEEENDDGNDDDGNDDDGIDNDDHDGNDGNDSSIQNATMYDWDDKEVPSTGNPRGENLNMADKLKQVEIGLKKAVHELKKATHDVEQPDAK